MTARICRLSGLKWLTLWRSGRQTHLCTMYMYISHFYFSPRTESYAEVERVSTTVQESLNESQQICKVSTLCLLALHPDSSPV